MKDDLAYIFTFSIAGLSVFEVMNGVLTTLVLVATLAFWIQKNINHYKRNK
jgi:hypothetical protein